MTLVYLSVAFVAGLVLGEWLHLQLWALPLALAPLSLLLLRRVPRKTVVLISLSIFTLVAGGLRYQASIPTADERSVQFYNDGAKVTFTGVIVSPPDVRDRTTHLIVESRSISAGGNLGPVSGRVLIYAPRSPQHRAGETVKISGKLQTPSSPSDFDYRGYLANQGIYSTITYPDIVIIGNPQGFRPLDWVYSLRTALADRVAEVLPEPQAALAQGIILGIRSGIPQDVSDDFRRTGTTHVLVISGMQFSIVAGMLTAAGIWLFGKRRYLYVWLALAAIWLYALLTGMTPPVVRSAIMLSLFLGADILGRQRNALPALALAAAVMVALSPRLPWDASFQLSFLATLGLVLTAPPLQSFGRNVVTTRLGEDGFAARTLNWIVDSLAVTVGVTILIWPVIAHYFGVLSIVSPFATLLLLPALSPLLITGTLAALLGFILPPLGQAMGWVAWLFASYMLGVVKAGASLPASAVDIGQIHPAALWGYYTLLGLGLLAYRGRARVASLLRHAADRLARVPLKLAAPAFLSVTVLAGLFTAATPDDRLHVSFLDVGQGDAVYIRTPSHQDFLVDGGPGAQAVVTELSRRMPFWDRTIDLIVLTHPHADHLSGLIEVLERYQVRQVLLPVTDSDTPLWQEWLDAVAHENAVVTVARTAQVIESGSVRIEVLSALPSEGPDAGATVLRVSEGRVSFLLTADIPRQTEMTLVMHRAPLNSTVLKVGHHGSDTSTSAGFLAVVSPQAAVISVGAGNSYDHPHQEVMARLADTVGEASIYRTDVDGAVEFTTDGQRLWVRADNPSR